jgi:hypothetical protein
VLQLQQQIENSLAKQVGSQGPFWEAAGETVINDSVHKVLQIGVNANS